MSPSGATSSCWYANIFPVRPSPDWISSRMNSTSCFRQSAADFSRNPGGGIWMPASPWIGSTTNAHVFGEIAFSSASRSPYGITTKPGVSGLKPSLYCASVDADTIVIVRPWKLFLQTMISCRPTGIPFTFSPHLRAALNAVSTASAPEFIGRATSIPVISCSSA